MTGENPFCKKPQQFAGWLSLFFFCWLLQNRLCGLHPWRVSIPAKIKPWATWLTWQLTLLRAGGWIRDPPLLSPLTWVISYILLILYTTYKKEKTYSKENPTVAIEEKKKKKRKYIRNSILFISLVPNVVDVIICCCGFSANYCRKHGNVLHCPNCQTKWRETNNEQKYK